MNMNISGEVVRCLRLERGWTQDHLAALAHTNPKTIQRVEKTGVCSLETRAALAAVLEIDVKQLDGEETVEQPKSTGQDGLLFYRRLPTGQAIVDIFEGTYWYRFSHEEPRTVDDVDFIAHVVQDIQDWSEVWSDLDAGQKVKATYSLTELQQEVERRGLWIFGLRTNAKFKLPQRDGTHQEIPGSVSNIHVAYADSDRIIVLNPKSGKK